MSSKIIKTVMVAVIAIFATSSVYAQYKGEMSVGGGLSVATGEDYTNVGIGAKFQWNPIDNLRVEPSVNYFFKKDRHSIWDLSANVHYLFAVTDKITLYPLAGLGIQTLKAHYGDIDDIDFGSWTLSFHDASDTHFAFNLGGGADFKLSENWVMNFEFKYKIADLDRAVFSLGFAYKF